MDFAGMDFAVAGFVAGAGDLVVLLVGFFIATEWDEF